MKNKKWILRLSAAIIFIILIVCVSHITVIPDPVVQMVMNEETGEEEAVPDLSVAEQYAADNWESKMVPTIRENAVPVETVVEAARADVNAAGEKYGTRANETSAWNFCITGSGKVLEVESAEKASRTRLVIDVPPYDGTADCKVQVSSVIKTNALRDSVGFLKLDDFANQVEFAELTKAFNAMVQKTVLKDLDASHLGGKEITFTGSVALTKYENPDDMLIIPIELTVGE